MLGLRPVETVSEFREILHLRKMPPAFIIEELIKDYMFFKWPNSDNKGITTYLELNVFVAGLLINFPSSSLILDIFLAEAASPEAALVRARAILAAPHGFPPLGSADDYVRMPQVISRALEKHHNIVSWTMPEERNLEEELVFEREGWAPLGG